MTPTTLLLTAVVFLCAMFAFIAFAKLHHGEQPESEEEWKAPLASYTGTALLSEAEKNFFRVLEQVVSPRCRVFAKVRLADLITPIGGHSRSASEQERRKLSGSHADFVLCDSATLNVLAVVELDDKTHASLQAGFRDAEKDSALERAGIEVVRFAARSSYAPEELRQRLDLAISQQPAGSQRNGPQKAAKPLGQTPPPQPNPPGDGRYMPKQPGSTRRP